MKLVLLFLLIPAVVEAGGHVAVAPSVWFSTQDGGDSDVGALLTWRQDVGEEMGYLLELRGGYYPGFFDDQVDVTAAEIALVRTVEAQENRACYFGIGAGYYDFDSIDIFSWSDPIGAFVLAGMERRKGAWFASMEFQYIVLRPEVTTSTEALGLSALPFTEFSDTASFDGFRVAVGVGLTF